MSDSPGTGNVDFHALTVLVGIWESAVSPTPSSFGNFAIAVHVSAELWTLAQISSAMGANQSGDAEEVKEEEPVRKSVRWGEESGTERSVRMMQASGEGGRAKNRSMSVMAAQNFEDRQAQRAEVQ